MPKFREALIAREQQIFVDREREVETFQSWLEIAPEEAPILAISGPGGVGKSFLLREFGRIAQGQGREVVLGDARTFDPNPSEFERALKAGREGNLTSLVNETKPLVMLDTFEELSPLSRWMQEEFLPNLDDDVRLIFSGRRALGQDWTGWSHLIHSISLKSFSEDAARDYLKRRGVDRLLADQILDVTGGHPLALALAADLAVSTGLREFGSSPEWMVTLRLLVDNLLADVRQKDLRELLEAAAVVRQFDEDVLAAISGSEDVGAAFSELCRFSFVRPSRHGLMLHDDIRRLLFEDLKWRRPERVKELRDRAQTYYRGRMRRARPGEFDWMVAERLYLWENALFQALYFPEGDPEATWVEPARHQDRDEILAMQARFYRDPDAVPATPPEEETSGEFLSRLLDYAGAEVVVARDREGRVLGYGFMLFICRDSLELLPPQGAIHRLVDTAVSPIALRELPKRWGDSNTLYMSTIVPSEHDTGEALGALGQYGMKVMSRGNVFLACTGEPMFSATLEGLGFVRLPEVGSSSKPGQPVDGWMLDMTLIGADGWLNAWSEGRPVPRLGAADFPEAVRWALQNDRDDRKLEESPLLSLAETIHQESEASGAEAVRALIASALERARSRTGPDDQLALQAVELAYMESPASHEQVAERLAISRSTFFRLLRKGVDRLTESLRSLVSTRTSLHR